MNIVRVWVTIFAASVAAAISAKDNHPVTIIASGEVHAQIDSCGCPNDPVGGLTRISTIVKELRGKSDALFIDAGGFSAGGIYDLSTQGRSADSLRTEATIAAMGKMGYDAVAVGDEELGFGMRRLAWAADDAKLPIVCANLFYGNGHYATQPWRFVRRGGLVFGITAVVTGDKLFSLDTSVRVEDPVASVKQIWKKLRRNCDVPVIISHLGEDESIRMADSFPEARVVLNGHRKTTTAPALVRPDSSAIIQFGYEGKTIVTAELRKSRHRYVVGSAVAVPVNVAIEPDAEIERVAAVKKGLIEEGVIHSFDLYIMSHCPYGIPALGELVQLAQKAGKIKLSVWFVGDAARDSSGYDSLRSLHGPAEIIDEEKWLAVQAIDPSVWLDFLALRTVTGLSTDEAIEALSLDTAKISAWVKESGRSVLASQYRRNMRLGINASPVLFIDNTPYKKDEISFVRFAKDFCAEGKVPKSFCDSLPACIDDGECVRPGFIGICGQDGACSFIKDAAFDFMVIVPDSCRFHTENDAIETTRKLFPAAEIKIIRRSDAKADSIIKLRNIQALPYYEFGSNIQNAHNFQQVKSGAVSLDSTRMTFAPDVMKPAYFFRREAKSGELQIFVDPLSRAWREVLSALDGYDHDLSNIHFWPLAVLDGDSAGDPVVSARTKRAELWFVCAVYYPKIYRAFLDSAGNCDSLSQIKPFLTAHGVSPDEFSAALVQAKVRMNGLRDLEHSFARRDPVIALLDNREIVPVDGREFLAKIIDDLKKRK